MAMTGVVSPKDVDTALSSCKASTPKLSSPRWAYPERTLTHQESIYEPRPDKSGLIEDEEFELFLQDVSSCPWVLTDKETVDILKVGDSDGDGKMGVDGESASTPSSQSTCTHSHLP
nr:parvalbumin beta-like [Equus asinus]